SFAVDPAVVVSHNLALVSGTAPVTVKRVLFNGTEWPVRWTSVTAWTAALSLQPGTNAFRVMGVDRHDEPVGGASNPVTVVVMAPLPPPLIGANVNGNQFAITWQTVDGQRYQVEYVDDLGDS